MIKLNDIKNPEDKKVFSEIVTDKWLCNKVNWTSRIKSKKAYIEKNLPEILNRNLKVLDIGTGPGEFLEVCNDYGCESIGITLNKDFYGAIETKKVNQLNNYDKYCEIHHRRQGLKVYYVDMLECIENEKIKKIKKGFDIINCEHAINLIFRENFSPFLNGEIFNGIYKNDGLWIFNEKLDKLFDHMFRLFSSLLLEKGILFISALHSGNAEAYSNYIIRHAINNGFELIKTSGNLVHKFIKRSDVLELMATTKAPDIIEDLEYNV